MATLISPFCCHGPVAWAGADQDSNRPRLGILIPTQGKVSTEWAVHLAQVARTIPTTFKIYTDREYRLDDARNNLAESALRDGCDKVFFWDTDIYLYRWDGNGGVGHYPHAVVELWQQEYPVVSGLYITDRDTANFYARSPEGQIAAFSGGLSDFAGKQFIAEAAATGILMIDARVLRKLPRPWFRYKLEFGPNGERNELSEDISFGLHCYDAGFPVLVDSQIVGIHEKRRFRLWSDLDLKELVMA